MTNEDKILLEQAEEKERAAKERRKSLIHYCPYCNSYYDYNSHYLCRNKECVKLRNLDKKKPLGMQLKLCSCKSKAIDISNLKHQRATFYCEKCKPTKIKYYHRK